MKNLQILCIIMLSFLITLSLGAKDIIDTVAGTYGQAGYTGDAIMALDARLYTPLGVCVDEFGRIYIADTQNNRIRMVDVSGVIYTKAGNGIFGYNGNDKYGDKCSFAFPMGVAVETTDKEKQKVRVYITDSRNNRIRMVNEFNIMVEWAGSGRFGFSGDGGPAERANFKWPASASLDENGNMYIADTYNNRIRVMYRGNGPIAGNGGSGENKIIPNPKRGYIYTLAGSGRAGYGGDGKLATEANLKEPWDVRAVGGVVYISDKGNHIVRKIDQNGIISTIAGIPGRAGYYGDILKAYEEKLNTPYGIWADANNVYIADTMNSRIRRFPSSGESIATICGFGIFGFAGDGAAAVESMLSHPVDVYGDGKGNFYLCDLQNQVIRVIKPEEGGTTPATGGAGAP